MLHRSLSLFAFAAVLPFLPAQQRIPAGPWTPADVPDGWVVHRTRNYEVQSEAGEEKAIRLGEHMEVMNKVYRQLFRPDKAGLKRRVIKLLKNRESYLAYGAPPSSAAYYSRSDREMVCYDTGKWSDAEPAAAAAETGPRTGPGALERRLRRLDDLWKMDILGCAAHEGWHQYFDWLVVSFVTLPSWINEGMGDYFYTAAPKDARGRKLAAELGRLNDGRLMVLRAAMLQDRLYPLERLVRMSKSEFYADGSVCYAQGWAFCQFLLHGGDKKYAKIIPNFVRYVRSDTNMADVTDRAFKGIDFEELDAEFRAWVANLQIDGLDDDEDEAEGGGAGPATPTGAGADADPAAGDAPADGA